MRCPHCASPRATPPTCLLCGRSLAEPADDTPVPGLLPTLQEPTGEVAAGTMPELAPTLLATPDVVHALLPGLETTRAPAVEVEVEAEPLDGLMTRDRPWAEQTEADVGSEHRRCSECGVLNPAGRDLCLACGKRMPHKAS